MKKRIVIAAVCWITGASTAVLGQTNVAAEATNHHREILEVWLRLSYPWFFDQVALLLITVAIGCVLMRRANVAAFILRASWCLLAFSAFLGMWRAGMRVFSPEDFRDEMLPLLPYILVRIATSSFLALLLTCLYVLIGFFKRRTQSPLLDILGLVALAVATAIAGLSMFVFGRIVGFSDALVFVFR